MSALVHFAWNFPRKLVKVAYHWPTANRIICALVKTCCHWLKAPLIKSTETSQALVESYKYNRNFVGLLKCLREMPNNSDIAFGWIVCRSRSESYKIVDRRLWFNNLVPALGKCLYEMLLSNNVKCAM